MMPRYFRSKAVLAKIETNYGVDAVPTGAANAILLRNVTINPMDNEVENRELVQAYWGLSEELPVGTKVSLDFEVEMAGSGAAGTAPAYGPLLRACAFSETVSAGVNVVYAPVSGGVESLSMYFNLDGKLHKILGARGTLDVKLNAKKIPVFAFKMQGLYGGVPTDTALPAQTLSAWQTPLPVNNANTGAFSLHGYASTLYDFDMSLGGNLVYRNLVGVEDVVLNDRAPTGNLVIEDPTMAQKDFFTIAKNATLGAFTITHGTTAGNKVKLDAPAVQLTAPAYEDRDGVVALKMGARFKPTVAGNDEFTITVL